MRGFSRVRLDDGLDAMPGIFDDEPREKRSRIRACNTPDIVKRFLPKSSTNQTTLQEHRPIRVGSDPLEALKGRVITDLAVCTKRHVL